MIVGVIFNDVTALDHMTDIVDGYATLEHTLGCMEPKGESRERIGHESQFLGCQFINSVIGAGVAGGSAAQV